jgi:hypothetical protein|tara:strand:+ start:3750 stop:4577 length:828 start_codon:yes stop_codon:yes gene_type:complete
MKKEKLYLIIIIIFSALFSCGVILYANINYPTLTKSLLSRVASFGPLWIIESKTSINLSSVKSATSGNSIQEKSNNLPTKLFGIKILDNAEKYLNVNSKGEEKNYGGKLKHTWYKDKDIKKLITDTFFDKYLIASVDKDIAVIQGQYNITGYLTQKDFKERCVDRREKFFTDFTNEHNINRNKFNRKYYKGKTKKNRVFYVDRISADYELNNIDLRLYLSCNYGFRLTSGFENIITTFVLRLGTIRSGAAVEKYSNYMSTSNFNETFLKNIKLDK